MTTQMELGLQLEELHVEEKSKRANTPFIEQRHI